MNHFETSQLSRRVKLRSLVLGVGYIKGWLVEAQKGEGDILAVIQNPSNSENQLSALSPCMTQPEHAEQKTLLSTLPWLLLFYCLHYITWLFWNCPAQANDWIIHFRNFLKDPFTFEWKAPTGSLCPKILCIFYLKVRTLPFSPTSECCSWFLPNYYRVPIVKCFFNAKLLSLSKFLSHHPHVRGC